MIFVGVGCLIVVLLVCICVLVCLEWWFLVVCFHGLRVWISCCMWYCVLEVLGFCFEDCILAFDLALGGWYTLFCLYWVAWFFVDLWCVFVFSFCGRIVRCGAFVD